MLRTHPVNTSRISDALGRADDYGVRQRPDSLRFQLARARLRERSFDRPEKSLAAFRASLREGRYPNETAERYGLALALLRSGQLDAAKAESAALLKAHPGLLELVALDAQIDLKQGRSAEALGSLRQAVGLSPDNWALRTVYAQALLTAGQSRQAMDQLRTVVRMRPGNAGLYELLSQAAIKSGNKAATYRYQAERLYAEGDVEPAIRQLDFALRQRDIGNREASEMQVLRDNMMEEQCASRERDEPDQGRSAPGLSPCPAKGRRAPPDH